MNPKIVVNLKKLETNLRFLTDKIKAHDLSIMAITKVHCADPQMIQVFEQVTDIEYFGDSRLENLKSYQDSAKKKALIRIVMPSEVTDTVRYADLSFHSELKTLQLINEAAEKQNKIHGVLLMFDLGDLREGFFEEESLLQAADEVLAMSHVNLVGLGTNLMCYGGVIPSEENLARLVALKEQIESKHGIALEMISGGNSSSLHLLEDDQQQVPEGITNLRIGEAYLLGRETAFQGDIVGTYQDVFTLEVEIVELKEKPSYPIGQLGPDAFGNKPVFEDKGIRLRGVLAIGRQDVDITNIYPLDTSLEIVGASSDHLIVDFTDADGDYKVGDVVAFNVEYGALLSAFTSKYVTKAYRRE
ncbi:MAG: ornithine racemase Orr [Turicibacter sp.]|nr:ornithine racemase Orr [Turicibacter sp.]